MPNLRPYQIKGRVPKFDDPVNILKTSSGRFKDIHRVAEKELAINKERWNKLLSKPLNKWTKTT